jgi:antitoxin component YwqK of YwqJK toxin-antitoxin module
MLFTRVATLALVLVAVAPHSVRAAPATSEAIDEKPVFGCEGCSGPFLAKGPLNSDGVREGSWVVHYLETNEIHATGQYKNGERTGLWSIYARGGELIAKGEFARGERVKSWVTTQGGNHIITFIYDESDPNIRWVESRKDGQKTSRRREIRIVAPQGTSWIEDGPTELYHYLSDSGLWREIMVYERGVSKTHTKYDPNGTVRSKTDHKKNTSFNRRFRDNGSLMDETRETKGKHRSYRDQEATYYDEDGKVVSWRKTKATAADAITETSFVAGVTCTTSYTSPGFGAPRTNQTPEVCKDKQGKVVSKPAKR